MAIFYRGARRGTHWHGRDAAATGFSPKSPGASPSINSIVRHIAYGVIDSPYISLTRSDDVAYCYALASGASITDPGFVYEIEIDDPRRAGVQLLDPVKELIKILPAPSGTFTYHHDGPPSVLLGIIDPVTFGHCLTTPCRLPPLATGIAHPPNLTRELETFVKALRDAEVLVLGNIPRNCVKPRHIVY